MFVETNNEYICGTAARRYVWRWRKLVWNNRWSCVYIETQKIYNWMKEVENVEKSVKSSRSMACNGVLTPIKNTPQNGNPLVLTIFDTLPPVLKLITLPSDWKQKNEDVKLIHKPLIQHNSQQIKKQNEIWKHIINLIYTLIFRLSTRMVQIGERCKPLQLISLINIDHVMFIWRGKLVLSFSKKLSRYQISKILWYLNVITLSNLYIYIRSLQV